MGGWGAVGVHVCVGGWGALGLQHAYSHIIMQACAYVCVPPSAAPASAAVQLERLAADKAAQQLALERDLAAARSEAASAQVKRRSTAGGVGGGDRSWGPGGGGGDDGVVPMEHIGATYQR